MKKLTVVLISVAVMVAFALPAMAETVFNEMSKSIQSWKCEPCKTVDATAQAVKDAKTAPRVNADKCGTTTDALYNKVPTGTVK